MKTTSLTPITVRDFSVNDSHAVIQTTIDSAEPVKDSLDPLVQASLTDMTATNTAMGNRMNLAFKSPETEEVNKEDITRDGWWSGIRNDVNNACRSPDADSKAAGKALKIFFAPYWKLDKEPLGTETDTIIEMLAKLAASATLTAHAATINITTKLTNLGADNLRLAAMYSTRTTAQVANVGPSASSLKADAAISYNQFCALIELANALTPSDALKTLFNNMEQVHKKYAVIYNVTDNGEDDDDTTGTAATANPA